MDNLTAREAELLTFIQSCGPVCPSIREMALALGFSPATKAYTCQLLKELVAKGRIRRLFNRERAVEVIGPLPGLHLIHGPDHWASRAAESRRQWAEAA